MHLRIGTRRSPLALAQANEVAEMLRREGHEAELVPILTAGDRGAIADGSPAGVKGLFVAEITDALLRGDVDLAVHSAKDLPVEDPEGIVVAAVPPRADPGDVLVSRDGGLAAGAVVGTSSLRRRAQLRRSRPGLLVRDLRGNVETRLGKVEAGEVDAVVLAAAGLARLGISPANAEPLPTEEMVPAPGQGALAIQARKGSEGMEAAAALDDAPSRRAFATERGLVRRVGGGCRLPLGAFAVAGPAGLRLVAVVARPDGTGLLRAEAEGTEPEDVAAAAAEELLAGGAERILREAT